MSTATAKPDLSESEFHAAIHSSVGKPVKKYIRIGHGKLARTQSVSKQHKCEWASSVVDLINNKITLSVYLNFEAPSVNAKDFSRLKKLAAQGIEEYWSRKVAIAGKQFNVFTEVKFRKQEAVDATLKISKNPKYARSHNSGIFQAVFIYNEGFYQAHPSAAVSDFKHVAAHEFGHSILEYFGGKKLSWGHKGSTHALLQSVKSSTPGYPAKGELDLMKYYNEDKNASPPSNLHLRTKAAEIDVKRLIWMSNLRFSNPSPTK